MRTTKVSDKCRLVCRGVAEAVGLPFKGKRNAIGSILPPRSSPSVNGAIPAVLVAAADNCDVKLPYRLAITDELHEASCSESCPQNSSLESIVDAAEGAQAAQVGYHCDYGNKRQPVGMHEAKQWSRGHTKLSEQV